jgi:hypothetical protein
MICQRGTALSSGSRPIMKGEKDEYHLDHNFGSIIGGRIARVAP